MTSFHQRVLVLLLLLFIVGCSGQHGRPGSVVHLEGKKDCSLNPAMDITSCKAPEDENFQMVEVSYEKNDERAYDYEQGYSREEQDRMKATKILALRMRDNYFRTSPKTQNQNSKVMFKVDGETTAKVVPHSTTCGLIPEYSSNIIYKCTNGVWTTVADKLSGWTKAKRATRYKLIKFRNCYRRCSGWWIFRRCYPCCVTNKKRDYYPTITCPRIPDTYTDIRQTEKFMRWSPATARDPEDGVISTRQTFGPRPNSLLKMGRYVVCYQAKDRRGSTATCETKFNIKVRTCPNQGQVTPYTFSWFTWFPNGNIFCSHNNTYGSVCTFSCHTNYELSGASRLTCQANGLWTPTKPTCQARNCPAPSPVANGAWTACSRRTIGSQCTLACNKGYNVNGSPTITCQADRTWTTPGICKDSEVPDITCPADISTYSLPKKQPVQVTWVIPTATDNSGGPVVVTSNHNPGDLFQIGNTTVVYQARDTSDNIAVCSMYVEVKVKYCSSLTSSSGELISCTHGYAAGSDCSFSCPEGHQLIGVSTRTCLDSKAWSNSQPSCQKNSCGSPSSVANGNFVCPGGHLFGQACTLQCDVGYLVTGPPTITCEANSRWTAGGSCRDTQVPKFPKGCPDVSKFASIFGQPTYVMYPTPEVTDNSGDSVTVTADITSGSEFQVSTTDVTFTAVDMSGNTATCILAVTVVQIECPNPLNTDLDNSVGKVMRFSCPNGHVFGASCSISCFDNSPLAGPATITCEQNGTSTGYWGYGNVKPFCNAKECPAPEAPTYGSIACDDFADREVCSVLCREGYSFPKMDLQSGVFFCLRTNGEWEPRSISSNMCFSGRAATDVEVMADIYYYSNSCSSDSEEIKRKFINIINSTSIFKNICGIKNVSCAIETVTVTCGARAKRSIDAVGRSFVDSWNPRNKRSVGQEHILRTGQLLLRSKRAVDSATHLTVVAFNIEMSYDQKEDAVKTKEFYEDLTFDLHDQLNEATKAGEFDIPEAGETQEFSYGSSNAEFECQPPTLFNTRSALCVGCGQGYVYVSKTQPCAACPRGTYQTENEGTECVSCLDGYSTKKEASTSSSDCLAICLPGTYSKTGMQPCDTCRRGSYQAGTGQSSCDFCPYGMSTVSDGATSKDDCKFYLVKFNDASNSLNLTLEEGQLLEFTAAVWFKSPSDLIDTQTSFSLTRKPGDASFGCGDFPVYISVSKNSEVRSRREWNHLVLTLRNGAVTLFVNGIIKENRQINFLCPGLRLGFTSSELLNELILSGLQISDQFLTPQEVASMSLTCNLILEGNILPSVEQHVDSLITPSSCDDTDNCKDNPCGSNGVCTDLKDNYRCDCDNLWSGANCEIEPDFCADNKCKNNAQCVNQGQDGNYTCMCTEDYRGRLCTERIIHGGWSNWSAWSQCPVTCDSGTISRSRTCDNPIPGPDGKMCEGPDEEMEICQMENCPVDGGFSKWTTWVCPVTCGEGTSTRTRECNNPAPAYGGNDCVGPLKEAKDCENLNPCPVDGGYGNFSDWSPCSKSCGGGVTTRERTCDSPAPQNGGIPCDPSLATESESCNEEQCPVCRSLIRPSGTVETIQCTYNESVDMKVCKIICKKGYLTDEERTFLCGMATNYTWSHVTPDNPRGYLPDCEEAKIPESLTMKVAVAYPSEGLNSDVVSMTLNKKLNQTLNCTNCSYKVGITNVSSRRKRATESIETEVVLTVEMPNPDLDLKTASDDEIEKQGNSIYDFEMATQRLANNSDYIFAVTTTDNKTILPDSSSVVDTVEFGCSAGTEPIDGACVNCGAGYYSITGDSVCQLCPKGYYQNNVKSTSCKPCPEDTSTAGLGARSADDCIEDPSIYYPDYVVDYTDIDPSENSTGGSDTVTEEINPDDDDADTGLIVGAVVGSVAFVILVIIAVVVYFTYFKRTKIHQGPSPETNEPEHIYDEPDNERQPDMNDDRSERDIVLQSTVFDNWAYES